jgi:[ribosomal protein S5]-alanine N-acetyltransferase
MRLEPLTAAHQDAILEFETANRDYFRTTIPDRGDSFFADYPAYHAVLLACQGAGTDRFHVLTTDDGTIAGRVNLVCIADGEAELGYRIGQEFAGRGLATEAVRQICELARTEYGLTRLRARTTDDNAPSATVLLRNGFVVTGTTTLSGGPGHHYRRDL